MQKGANKIRKVIYEYVQRQFVKWVVCDHMHSNFSGVEISSNTEKMLKCIYSYELSNGIWAVGEYSVFVVGKDLTAGSVVR